MPVGKIHKKKKFRGCATSGVCGKGRKTEVHYCYARSLFNCTIVRHILPTGPIVNAVCMCVSMYVRMYVWYVFVWTLISQTKKTASAINLCSQCWSSKWITTLTENNKIPEMKCLLCCSERKRRRRRNSIFQMTNKAGRRQYDSYLNLLLTGQAVSPTSGFRFAILQIYFRCIPLVDAYPPPSRHAPSIVKQKKFPNWIGR